MRRRVARRIPPGARTRQNRMDRSRRLAEGAKAKLTRMLDLPQDWMQAQQRLEQALYDSGHLAKLTDPRNPVELLLHFEDCRECAAELKGGV